MIFTRPEKMTWKTQVDDDDGDDSDLNDVLDVRVNRFIFFVQLTIEIGSTRYR